MKRFLSLSFILMFGAACSSPDRNVSGAEKQNAYEQQREEEQVETVRDPVLRPGTATTNQPQPF